MLTSAFLFRMLYMIIFISGCLTIVAEFVDTDHTDGDNICWSDDTGSLPNQTKGLTPHAFQMLDQQVTSGQVQVKQEDGTMCDVHWTLIPANSQISDTPRDSNLMANSTKVSEYPAIMLNSSNCDTFCFNEREISAILLQTKLVLISLQNKRSRLICCQHSCHGSRCRTIGSVRQSRPPRSQSGETQLCITPQQSRRIPRSVTETIRTPGNLVPAGNHRTRRSATNVLAEAYAAIDHRLLPPRNLQITPVRFGAFNISWVSAPKHEPWISHFELVLISLGQIPNREEDSECIEYRKRFNLSDREPSVIERTLNQGQLTMNVSAPASWTVVTGLPPDNFYRVLLFAMAGIQRSPPASMPSSPRVPAAAPRTAPREIKVTTRGIQNAKVAWEPPDGANCTGEIINYVISINSSRLIDPMVIKVPQDKRSYVVNDLVPGTQYTIQVAASTRGGVGVLSKPLNFRTGGETPLVDLDEADEVDVENLITEFPDEWSNAFHESFGARDAWIVNESSEINDPRMFLVPAKIHNLRATATQTSIHLKWTVALRRVNPHTEEDLFIGIRDHRNQAPGIASSPMRIVLSRNQHDKGTEGYLPSGTKYLIRWGDMHPGPFEDTVRGDQTEYLIENLRPGTIYYIRVISVTQLGEGPAAYTVTRTRTLFADDLSTATGGPLIPVNLVVQAVGSTWARVGWELPSLPSPDVMPSMIFQIKYYAINSDGFHETHRGSSGGFSTHERDVELVNLTVPNHGITSNRGANTFKTILRSLRPGTQYEFGVCLIQSLLPNDPTVSSLDSTIVSDTQSPYCWSMVQGFETSGQSPKDPPQRISILIPKSPKRSNDIGIVQFDPSDAGELSSEGAETYPVRVIWNSPAQSNGHIVAYMIYLTAGRKQSFLHWVERSVDGALRSVDIRGLDKNRIYYMRLAARNRHGRSPLSPIVVFRTPDEQGIGGGMFKLSRDYYDVRDIDEPLVTMMTGITERTAPESEPMESNLPWIVVGSVLGGALVIMIVITAVLLNRCRKGRNSLGLVKRQQPKQPYLTAYPNFYHTDPNRPGDMNPKVNNFTIQDACLGSCSLSGSATGGSQTGPLALRLPDGSCGVTHDSRHKYDHASHMVSPTQTSSCQCSDWTSKGAVAHNHPCPNEMKCNCCNSFETNMPWTNVGHTCNLTMGGCLDDRHSTPAGSEKDASGCISGGARRIDPMLGRKLSARGALDVHECFNHNYSRTDHSSVCPKHENWQRGNDENVNTVILPPREMTLSYLASTQHGHADCRTNCLHGDTCELQQNIQPQAQSQQQQTQQVQQHQIHRKIPMLKTHQMNEYNPVHSSQLSAGERSPEFVYIQSRHGAGMMANHGFTGSGSLNDDEAIASSPASSSAGRASGGLPHLSTSPTHGGVPIRKFHQNSLQGFGKSEGDKHHDTVSPHRIGLVQSTAQVSCESRGKQTKTVRPIQSNASTNLLNDLSPSIQQKYRGGNFSNAARVNVMSSDYASQQSSLSNPSSASSNTGFGFSPERPASNTSAPMGQETQMSNVGLSFALDRVPTPEPTPRPAPFSRLAAGDLLNPQLSLRVPDFTNRDDYLGKSAVTEKLLQSPLLKKTSIMAAPPGFDRERTPETPDSISEKELMRGYSAEELNQEMANLEGLMKDLNQITQNQFDC